MIECIARLNLTLLLTDNFNGNHLLLLHTNFIINCNNLILQYFLLNGRCDRNPSILTYDTSKDTNVIDPR